MDELTRFWSDLIGRASGPMMFRFVLQPIMAMLYATRDGVRDAHAGRPAYFWAIFTHRGERGRLLREGVHAVNHVILLSIGMDVIYQILVFKRIHPLEVVAITVLLAFVPYLLVRGPANRITRLWMGRNRPSESR
jgi:hypothetical protein